MNTCKTFQEGVGLVQRMSLPDSSDVDAQMEAGMIKYKIVLEFFFENTLCKTNHCICLLEDIIARLFNNKLFVFRMRLERWMVLHLQFPNKATILGILRLACGCLKQM